MPLTHLRFSATMSDEHLTVPKFCRCQTGVFYVRPCGKPAVFQCAGCGRSVCGEHANTAMPEHVLCPDCDGGGQSQAFAGGAGRRRNSADDGADWSDGGMVFADEDYAAFDALSDFDMNVGGDAYDS